MTRAAAPKARGSGPGTKGRRCSGNSGSGRCRLRFLLLGGRTASVERCACRGCRGCMGGSCRGRFECDPKVDQHVLFTEAKLQ